MRAALILALLTLLAPLGCVDENKRGCRTDGDCRGVRVCQQDVCVTPPGFADEDLLGEDPDDNNSAESVLGEACEEPEAQFRFGVLASGIELQALAAGVEGQVLAPDPEAPPEVFSVGLAEGARITVEYTRPLSALDGPLLDLAPGDAVSVRDVEERTMWTSRVLSIHEAGGALILAACDSDNEQLPCQGAGWRFVRGEGGNCDPIATGCSPGVRFPLDLNSDEVPGDPLFAGQRQLLSIDGVGWLRFVGEAITLTEPCPDVPSGWVNAVLFRH